MEEKKRKREWKEKLKGREFIPSVSRLTNSTLSTFVSRIASNFCIFAERIQLWLDGKYETLMRWIKALATSRLYDKSTEEEKAEINKRRALWLAKDDTHGKEALALGSLGILCPSAEVISIFQEKHAQCSPTTESYQPTYPNVLPPCPHFTPGIVFHWVWSFSMGSPL